MLRGEDGVHPIRQSIARIIDSIRFDSPERLDAVMSGSAIKALVAEFDRCWLGRVARTREILAVADEFDGQKFV